MEIAVNAKQMLAINIKMDFVISKLLKSQSKLWEKNTKSLFWSSISETDPVIVLRLQCLITDQL